MATQDVITYLIRLEDKVTKELKATQKETAKLEKEVKSLRKAQEAQSDSSDKMAKRLESLKGTMKIAAAGFAATSAAMAVVAVNAIKTGASLEAFETRLSKLLGSAEKGKQRIDDLFELSARTPFSIDALVEADTTLEAFGVNANKVRTGVLDLAAVTGMDLKEAADAVGRAMVGGAGAADMLRDKGVRGWVEQRAGIKSTKMSLEEWQEALVDTLNNSEKVAGGTLEMSKTFEGLFSTLRDQWTLFSKDIADAGLFDTVKASMKVLLQGLGDNRAETKSWAKVVGEQLSVAFLRLIEIMGFLYDGTIAVGQAFMSIGEAVVRLIGLFRKLPSILSPINALANAFDMPGAEEIKEYADDMAYLNEQLGGAGGMATKAEEYTAEIKALRDKMMADKGALKGAGDDDTGLMRGGKAPTDEGKGAAKKGEAEKLTDKFMKDLVKSTTRAANAADKLGDKQISESEQLKKEMDKLADSMVETINKASALGVDLGGPEMKARFDAFQKEVEATADAYEAALKKETEAGLKAADAAMKAADAMGRQAEETVAMSSSVGNAMGGLASAMQTGGLSLLESLPDKTKVDETGKRTGMDWGAVGGGVGSLVGFGMQGDDAYNQEVATKAREAAKARQDQMKSEADALKAQGFSEEELQQRGLGQEDIAAAGEVTKEDEAAAAEDTDRGEVMADMVTQMVDGIIEGVMGLLEGLPEILQRLIPMLLIDLPTALIEMIPQFIEELIPVLITDLPAALIKMIVKLVPKLFQMLGKVLVYSIPNAIAKWWNSVVNWLSDLFSFGFQTGGYVPKTSSYLLHQGERVVPASGAGSGTATKGLAAFSGGSGGGPSVVVNTNVVDPDSLIGLSRLINQEMGALGRASVPIWGESEPMTSL